MKFSSWALDHPIPVVVLTSGAVLFGLLALFSLNREFLPPMVMPTSTVLTLWPGSSGEDVEEKVTSVLEDHFASISALTDLSSESREGVSIIQLRFAEDIEIAEMLQELRTRIDRAEMELPDDLAADPSLSVWSSADLPVFSFAVSGSWPSEDLTRFTEDVVIPDIYRVAGTARVEILGGSRKELQIRLDVGAMSATGIALTEVYGALREGNMALPVGLVNWEGGEWSYRVSGEFTSVDELENLVIGHSPAGPLRLSRIAEISQVYEEAEERIRSSDGDLVVVQVTKRESGNSIAMSRDIHRRLKRLAANNVGYEFIALHDDAEIVRLSLNTVVRSALMGIVMAVFVTWLFLRSWRSTLVVAVSVPIGLVIAFAGMQLAGQSMNVLTLAGITISLGMVVDASIVVLENIDRRHKGGRIRKLRCLRALTV